MMPPSNVNNSHGVPHTPEPARNVLQPRPMPLHPAGGVGPHVPAALSAAPNALSLLKALRRHLGLALTIGLILAAGTGSATWFLMPPPKITARTQLHVAPVPPRILFAEKNPHNNEAFLRNQAFLIKDRFVLNAALKEPDMAELILLKEQPDPLQWLEKEIKVEFPSPEFMRITLSEDRPMEQLIIVKAVTKAYLENVADQEHNKWRKDLEELKKRFNEFKLKAVNNRNELKNLQLENGAINEKGMAILQQVFLEELQNNKTRLSKVHQDLDDLQIEMGLHPDWMEHVWPQYAAVINSLPGPGLPMNHAVVALLHDEILFYTPEERKLDELIDKHPKIVELREKIGLLQGKIEAMRLKFKEEVFERFAKSDRAHLADLNEELAKRRKKLRPSLREQFRLQLHQEAQIKQADLQQRYRKLRMTETALLKKVEWLGQQIQQLRKNFVDLGEHLKAVEMDEKVMDRFLDKINVLEVEQEPESRITWPNEEAILYTPDATKRKLMATGGATVGILALVLLAFAWFEFQSRKVHSCDEVVHGLGLPLVGTVPDHSRRGWLEWMRFGEGNTAYSQSMLTESVDSARTMLLHAARVEKLQIVMITSAMAGEGKTSLASHLAASLARTGRRTLLLDSDLRNPTLHRLFDRGRAPGLSELLRGEVDLAGATRDTPIPNLWLISAGQADLVALQALALDAVPQIFQQLRSQYDFIVVDSCPVLPVADALLVGQHVDGVIFSLLREVSRLPRVYAAYQRLAVLGMRMLGAVVNGTHEDNYPADYRYVRTELE